MRGLRRSEEETFIGCYVLLDCLDLRGLRRLVARVLVASSVVLLDCLDLRGLRPMSKFFKTSLPVKLLDCLDLRGLRLLPPIREGLPY